MKSFDSATDSILNSQWNTARDVPDPTPLPAPTHTKIIVRPMSPPKVSKGGILIPNQTQDDLAYLMPVGRVLALGPLAYMDDDLWCVANKRFMGCKVGDIVTYGKFVGDKFMYKGVKLILMQDRHVDMVVPNEKDIEPFAVFSSSYA